MKEAELKEGLVPVYLGGVLIFNLDKNTSRFRGWKEAKILVCPRCLKSTTLGRDSAEEKFSYDPWRVFASFCSLNVKNDRGFKRHVALCLPSIRDDGIYRVICKKQKEIALRMARFSRLETGWDFPQLTIQMLKCGAEVFVFYEDGIIKGYAVFDKVELEKAGVLYVLCDLFTFLRFRKHGIATRLVEFGMAFLNIDRNNLGISFPIREDAENIVLNVIGEYVFSSTGHKFSKVELIEHGVNSRN